VDTILLTRLESVSWLEGVSDSEPFKRSVSPSFSSVSCLLTDVSRFLVSSETLGSSLLEGDRSWAWSVESFWIASSVATGWTVTGFALSWLASASSKRVEWRSECDVMVEKRRGRHGGQTWALRGKSDRSGRTPWVHQLGIEDIGMRLGNGDNQDGQS
jgi:hypothetical protein